MDLSELIEMKQTMERQLAIINKAIDALQSDTAPKSSRVRHYTKDRFVEVDPKVLAMAYIFMEPGITIEKLADKVGVTRQTIYNWKDIIQTIGKVNSEFRQDALRKVQK